MAPTKDNWTLEIGEDRCFHSGNRVAITTSGEDDGESWDATVAELWPADDDEDIRCGRLIAAAPDLLAACQQITAAHDNGWRILDAISLARNAAAKATGTPAETSAPDDPTQHNAVTADSKPALCPHCYQPTPAAQAIERHIADAQQDMPLPDLLAAILRRAERARSYGRLMLSTKDNCLDDVIRLAERALLQVNDKVKS